MRACACVSAVFGLAYAMQPALPVACKQVLVSLRLSCVLQPCCAIAQMQAGSAAWASSCLFSAAAKKSWYDLVFMYGTKGMPNRCSLSPALKTVLSCARYAQCCGAQDSASGSGKRFHSGGGR